MVKPGQKVVIITSNLTRPMPSKQVVIHVIEELAAGGIQHYDMTVIFVIGSHRFHN